MKLAVLLVISFGLLRTSSGGHILALHLAATGSYMKLMDSLLLTIAAHHRVTLYSVVHEDFPHPNVTVVALKAPPAKNFFFGGLFEILCEKGAYYITWNTVISLKEDFVEEMFAVEQIKQLLVTKEKFDLFLTFATFSEFSLQFADLFKVPLVQISPTIPFNHINDAVGNPLFLTNAYSLYAFERSDTFVQRVKHSIHYIMAHVLYNWQYMPKLNQITSKYFPSETLPIETVHRNTSLVLANINSGMGYARPNMPNVVEIGGIHCRPPRPLPADLEEFISGSGEHGIIYFSFGSSIRSKFPEYIKQAILRVFEKLPQRILWKWNEEISNLPANVMMSKWFSQQDILGHNKTKLFISQAGMFSMQESVYHGVPVLAIPIAFDQQANAFLANDLGYSEHINFCDFSEEKFYSLIKQLTSDLKYKQNVKRLSQLMRDQPLSIDEKLTWWIDYVVRHRGNPMVHQLTDKSRGFKRMDIDIILFLFSCLLITILVMSYLLYKAWKHVSVLHMPLRLKIKDS